MTPTLDASPTPTATWVREVVVVVTVPGLDERIVRVPVAISDDCSTVSGSFILSPDEARVLATATPRPTRRSQRGRE
jgi:hypothetical protein